MLTIEQKNRYLASPDICPYCGSDKISLGKVFAEVNQTVQNMLCAQCKKRWTNIYGLTRMEEDEWDMRKGEIKSKISREPE